MSDDLKYQLTLEDSGWRGTLSRALAGLRGFKNELRSPDLQQAGRKIFDKLTPEAKGFADVIRSFPGLAKMVAPLVVAFVGLYKTIQAVSEAAKFEAAVFRLRGLTGGLKEAREVMLDLTEGGNAVDAFFDLRDLEQAYRSLHNMTEGAGASAAMVKLLADVAVRTGQESIAPLAERFGYLYQKILSGETSMSIATRSFVAMGAMTQRAADQLEAMRSAGDSAGNMVRFLVGELSKGEAGVDDLAQSAEGLAKQITDAKGTIAREWGELFLPALSSWRRFELGLLNGLGRVLGAAKETRGVLTALVGVGARGTLLGRIQTARDFAGNLQGNRDGGSADIDALAAAADRQAGARPDAEAGKVASALEKLTAATQGAAFDMASAQDQAKILGVRLQEAARKVLEAATEEEQALARAGVVEARAKYEQALKRIADQTGAESAKAAQEAAQRDAADNARRGNAEAALNDLRISQLGPEQRARALAMEAERKRGNLAFAQVDADLAGTPENMAALAEAQLDYARSVVEARDAVVEWRRGVLDATARQAEVNQAAQSRRELEARERKETMDRLSVVQRQSLDVVGRADWLRAVRGGKSPETVERLLGEMRDALRRIEQNGSELL